MLPRELKIAYYYSLMHIDHYQKNVDQWQSHNSVWCRFVCTICMVEIGVDGSNIVGIPYMSSVTIFQSDQFVLSTIFYLNLTFCFP